MRVSGEGKEDPTHITQTAKWIETQSEDVQTNLADDAYESLLTEAAQPKSLVGQACIRLCGLVDQSAKSSSPTLRNWAFSQPVIRKLFEFYVEWNESDHTRSMKLVLDSLTNLLQKNPDPVVQASSKAAILQVLLPIVIGKSTKPAAKSALKILEHFLTKGVLTLADLKGSFCEFRPEARQTTGLTLWLLFLDDLSHWMHSHFVRPQAGRFIACLYRTLVSAGSGFSCEEVAPALQDWLVTFLGDDSTLLEGVRNYIYLPLFRNFRLEAIKFLEVITKENTISAAADVSLDSKTLLQLAALETGKKVGIVEEPALDGETSTGQGSTSLMLREAVFKSVLAHPSHDVRSVAFTLLITCPSTTKPYSFAALELLRKHLATFFADPDPKFRVDIAGKVRDMFKRVRGAICVLKRSIPRAKAKVRKEAAAAEKTETPVTNAILYHANLITLPVAQLESCLVYHEDFLRWYLGFLCTELIPTASYQRHAASLKAVHYILRVEGETSKTWETPDDQTVFFDFFGESWGRALFDLTLDPFDDIRDLAAKAIVKLLSDKRYRHFALSKHVTNGQEPSTLLSKHLERANERAKTTARVDHSDGAARVFQALYTLASSESERTQLLTSLTEELEQRISVAQVDLGRAVLEAPLHGTLSSIGYTWQVVTEQRLKGTEMKSAALLQERLLKCCEAVWVAVKDVLCDDSPEGHLPQDLDEVEGLDTKDLLSYCFRAVDESSNLMRIMVLALKYHDKETALFPTPAQFERIGNLSFLQLANLRHRGAFTTVSLAFAACCQRTKFVKDQISLLTTWYEGALEAIFAQRSTTRRSAGIPSMITGILSANAAEPSFETVLERLMSIAATPAYTSETDGSKLPQVHAFNCLKEIYKNALLASTGNKSEKYLPQCLELAANGLKSEVWAIRNCGLIFLRSLIDSLFGSQESKAMIEAGWDGKANRIPYHRYPMLPAVLVNLLKSGHQMMSASVGLSSAAAEAVFPALDIIRRAGPPEYLREELQTHISVYLASPVWHVREIAARTLCSCLLHDKWLEIISSLIQKSLEGNPVMAQNQCHGTLLTLKFVFERLGEVAPEQLNAKLFALIEVLVNSKIESIFSFSTEVQAAYLEVVNLIWAHQHRQGQSLPPLNLPTTSQAGGALQRRQQAISTAFLITAKESEQVAELRGLLLGGITGADTTVAVLETVPELWGPTNTSTEDLLGLSETYITLCHQSTCKEAQAQAMLNLAALLDHLLQAHAVSALCASLKGLWTALPLKSMNPAFANAVTRASGGIMAALSTTNAVGAAGLSSWGHMMAEAGLEDKDFDTRYAAAESLRSYFAATASCTSVAHLSSLLALHNALNDDDEEVRETASHAAQPVLGQLLVPLEAATRLTEWLAATFPRERAFRSAVLDRLAGGGNNTPGHVLERTSAGEQLAKALKFNDALFAVEEQNLFIDEVREAERWAAVYNALSWEADASDGDHEGLVDWMTGGLAEVQTLIVAQEDGPLGWASRPDVFAICSRILIGSVAMAKNSSSVRESLAEVKKARDEHAGKSISPLLFACLDDTSS